jgi:hypothetical protein
LFLIKRHACMQEKEACMGWKRKKGPREWEPELRGRWRWSGQSTPAGRTRRSSWSRNPSAVPSVHCTARTQREEAGGEWGGGSARSRWRHRTARILMVFSDQIVLPLPTCCTHTCL